MKNPPNHEEKKARQAEQEEKIRSLTLAGLSQRDIERATGIPQSTVSRIYQRINSGPQPIVQQEQPPAGTPPPVAPRRPARAALIAFALLILAAAIGSLTWLRAPASITACVHYSAARNITGISGTRSGHCDPGWQPLTLSPGR